MVSKFREMSNARIKVIDFLLDASIRFLACTLTTPIYGTMQLFWWYGIAAACVLTFLLLTKFQDELCSIVRLWSRGFGSRILVPRVARSAVNITVLDAIMLGTFVGTNTLLTVFSLRGSLMQITVIDMMLLFLGDRTNFIADYFGK